MFEHLRDIWHHRDLILSLAFRDVKARYKQTALGAIWALLQPLSMMVVFTLIFSVFAKMPSDGVPYPVFSYSALVFWTFFAAVIGQGTVSMVANKELIRKIYFPRETLLLAVFIAAALDMLIASTIFVGMLLYYHIPLTLTMLWVIPLLFLQSLLALSVVCLLAAAHVNFRDVGHGLPLVFQIWMFATPVAYPLSLIPEWFRPIYMLNPMATIIDGYRQAILHGRPPDLTALGITMGCVLLFGLVAFSVFKKAERTFADVI